MLEFSNDFFADMRKFSTDYTRRLFRDVNANLLRRFKTEFEKDE